MSFLEKMKNLFKKNKTDDINYNYDEAKVVLDNLGGLEYCSSQKRKGLSQKEVAKNLNITQPTLSKYCINKGCKWRDLNKPPKSKAKPKTTKKSRIKVLEELGGYDYIIEQRNLGKTYSQISVELGQDPEDNWISNYMRYRGYKTKQVNISSDAETINNAGGILFLKTELKTKSVKEVAKNLNIRQKAIYSYLYKRGYNMKDIRKDDIVVDVPEGAANWPLYDTWDREYTLDQFKKAIAFKGVKETAKALNCTEYTLRVYCAFKGIPL